MAKHLQICFFRLIKQNYQLFLKYIKKVEFNFVWFKTLKTYKKFYVCKCFLKKRYMNTIV